MTSKNPSRPFAKKLPVHPFRNQAQEQRFEELVRLRLGRNTHAVTIRGGVATVAGCKGMHGLANLAQICNQRPAEHWSQIIDEHFKKSERNSQPEEQLKTMLASNLAAMGDKIGVRIYGEEFLDGGMGEHIVHRIDLEQTVTVPIVDLGPSVMPMPTTIATAWGESTDALIQRGIGNLARLCESQWERLPIPIGEGVQLDVLGGDFYAAASILRAPSCLPRIGKHGNLLALPTRELLLSWPIDAPCSSYAIEALLAIANGKYQDGPGSITPHLYWRTVAGDHVLQQGTVEGGQAQLAPSPEFAQLLSRLVTR